MSTCGQIVKLLQIADSTFPVGVFSFSNGLEAAVKLGLVFDIESLEDYVRASCIQSMYTDGVATLHAYDSAAKGNYDEVVEADKTLALYKLNDESRLMNQRMGRKVAELSDYLAPQVLIKRWLDDIEEKKTPGYYPIGQALLFYSLALSPKELFSTQQFGMANMILGASLRLMRVSHFDTQRILIKVSTHTDLDYERVKQLSLDEMYAFTPGIDIMSSHHEHGHVRLFMS